MLRIILYSIIRIEERMEMEVYAKTGEHEKGLKCVDNMNQYMDFIKRELDGMQDIEEMLDHYKE